MYDLLLTPNFKELKVGLEIVKNNQTKSEAPRQLIFFKKLFWRLSGNS